MQRPTPAFDRATRRADAPRLAARFRRSRPRARTADPRIATLFWLAILVLGGLAATCIALGLSSPPHDSAVAIVGNNLHADHLIPKLNTTRTDAPVPAAAPAQAAPEPSAPAIHHRNVDAVPAATAEPPLLAEPKPLPAVIVSEATTEPAVAFPRREPTFGESPMIRTWNTLALASLLAVPAVAPAGAPADPDAKTILLRLEELRKNVAALSKKVEALPPKTDGRDVVAEIERVEKNLVQRIDKVSSDLKTEASAIQQEQLKQKLELQSLKSLKTKLDGLNEDVTTLFAELKKLRKQALAEVPAAPALAPTFDRPGLDDVRARLHAIEKAIAALQPSANGNDRVSLSPPAAPASSGRVQLINLYNEDMLFIVNDRPYRVEPNKTVQLDGLPSGSLTYIVQSETWGRRASRTTTLQPNETLTLTAR